MSEQSIPNEDILAYLIKENIMMRTQIGALRGLVTFNFICLQKLGISAQPQDLEKIYRELLQKSHEDMLVEHPFFEESWRQLLQSALGDIGNLFS